MRHYMTYAGTPSTDFDTFLATTDIFTVPPREYERISVPGRSGDLTVDLGSYSNLSRSYTLYTRDSAKIRELQAWLSSQSGYQRLEDTFEPEYFLMATVESFGDAVAGTQRGSLAVTFNCKPQRYLKIGEQPIELMASAALINPTGFDAQPLIRVYGTGTLTVGSVAVAISSNPGYIDLDCELMDAYYGSTNCNSRISLSGDSYPVLGRSTNITLGTGITKAIVTPRWWTL